jgi:cell division protein DivIC
LNCKSQPFIFARMQRVVLGLRKIFSNFYLGTSFLFLVWITFFDGNDLISLFSNRLKLLETESEIDFYQQKIDQVALEKSRLHGNPAAIERFAREKFLMKKDDEDVFVYPEDPNTSILDRLIGF